MGPFPSIFAEISKPSLKTPPHTIDVVDVSWVVLLQSESLLLTFGPGQHIHILPSSLDQMRMMAVIISPVTIMQAEMIVGQ